MSPTPNSLISVVAELQKRHSELCSAEVEQQLVHALCVKQGDLQAAMEFASTMLRPKEQYLAMEPFTTILLRQVASHLGHQDTCALRLANKAVCGELSSKGNAIVPHITQHAEGHKIAPDFVESLTLQGAVGEVQMAQHMPNCRSVQWRPALWRATPPNEFIESPAFSLQGIEGIYFRFYPTGKSTSKKGYCSLYIGSNGTLEDVSLRLRIGDTTHIIMQKLQGEYVDGFVNFCDLTDIEQLDVTIDVLSGPNDGCQSMELKAEGQTAVWTIPRMTGDHLKALTTGDRITSDTFALPGLGDDACFVLYPKGDTVDAISKLGDFANVGLFGSSDCDVTFRLQAGKVSKVLTACAKHYQSKFTGATKSCGEFFDSCFGSLLDLVDTDQDQLKLHMEILDTQAVQTMSSTGDAVKWCFYETGNLFSNLRGDALHSRYFAFSSSDCFYNLQMRLCPDGTVGIALRQLNQKQDTTNVTVALRLASRTGAVTAALKGTMSGMMAQQEHILTLPKGMGLLDCKLEARMLSFSRA